MSAPAESVYTYTLNICDVIKKQQTLNKKQKWKKLGQENSMIAFWSDLTKKSAVAESVSTNS